MGLTLDSETPTVMQTDFPQNAGYFQSRSEICFKFFSGCSQALPPPTHHIHTHTFPPPPGLVIRARGGSYYGIAIHVYILVTVC